MLLMKADFPWSPHHTPSLLESLDTVGIAQDMASLQKSPQIPLLCRKAKYPRAQMNKPLPVSHDLSWSIASEPACQKCNLNTECENKYKFSDSRGFVRFSFPFFSNCKHKDVFPSKNVTQNINDWFILLLSYTWMFTVFHMWIPEPSSGLEIQSQVSILRKENTNKHYNIK